MGLKRNFEYKNTKKMRNRRKLRRENIYKSENGENKNKRTIQILYTKQRSEKTKSSWECKTIDQKYT